MENNTTIQQWEYEVKTKPHDVLWNVYEGRTWLNNMGEIGWELVAIAADNDNGGHYIFKRLKTIPQ